MFTTLLLYFYSHKSHYLPKTHSTLSTFSISSKILCNFHLRHRNKWFLTGLFKNSRSYPSYVCKIYILEYISGCVIFFPFYTHWQRKSRSNHINALLLNLSQFRMKQNIHSRIILNMS